MNIQSTSTPIYGGTGGVGGRGGQQGGAGGPGQGNIVNIKTGSVQVNYAQPDDYYKILDFLSPINFRQRQQEIFQTKEDGTGNWFLQEPKFLEWKSNSDHVLWCSGIPGAGKTVLASLIFEHLKIEERHDTSIVCAFFNYRESHTQSLQNTLGAIVQQMAQDKDDIEPVQILYQKHSKQRTSITLNEMKGLFKDYAQGFHQVYIVIDALDEYTSNKEDLLKVISDGGDNIRLLVTCRPQIHPPQDLEAVLVEVHPPDDDIKSYIMSRIKQSRRLCKYTQDKTVKTEIIKSLTDKAAGMFLFVKLQMDLFSAALTKNTLLQALKSLPADLDSLYTQTLERIKLEKPELADIGISALAWVAFAKRPLTVLELRAALAIPHTSPSMPDDSSMIDVEDLLAACHGLLTVNMGDDGQIFRLVHYSTQEFLDAIRATEFPDIHLKISKTLLACLQWAKNTQVIQQGYFVWDEHIDPEAHPLLLYSEYLLAHMKGDPEHSLTTEFLLGISSIKRYPGWNAKPWEFAYRPKPLTVLWIAVAGNLEYLVEQLLHNPAQIDTAGDTIAVAAYYGYLNLLIIMKAADIPVTQTQLDLALQQAALQDHLLTAKFLVAWGSDIYSYVEGESSLPFNISPWIHETITIAGTAILVAARYGHSDIVQYLLQLGADPNIVEGIEGTVLQAAAYGGHQDIVQLLLNIQADPNIVGGKYGTVLQVAAYRRQQSILELLLNAQADPNTIGGEFGTALQAAAFRGDRNIVEILLYAKADPNIVRGAFGTALQAAACAGYQDVVELLLKSQADPNLVGGTYGTALQAAAFQGHQAIVQLMLNTMADPNIPGGKYGAVLQAAAYRGHRDIVELLLNAKADPHIVGGYYGTALQAAAYGGHQDIVEILLDAKADSHIVGGHYGTALQAAAYGGHQLIVEVLLNAQADPNTVGGEYGTALQAAAYQGHQAVVQLMLDTKADPNIPGGRFGTALQAAAFGGHQDIVELLLKAHTDPNIVGGEYGTALQAAAYRGIQNTVQLLLYVQADPNTVGGEYGTALQAAAYWGHQNIIQLLLNANTDPNIVGGYYGTALQAAAQRGYQTIVELLLNAHTDPNTVGGRYGTALQAAACWGHHNIIELLLNAGTDPNITGGYFGTALQAGSAAGRLEIVQLLLQHNAHLDIISGHHGTALRAASVNGHNEIVRHLLAAGADPDLATNYDEYLWGDSPCSYYSFDEEAPTDLQI
uniref:NACHT domain-containing protein n=1 Tax=Mycena chlorophos TaxID=658473 RepID=A0ABQ0M008_MYCCL|nr:predicted protein [Mycena chlorophos]